MNFMFSWQEQYLTSERSERVRYCSCHSNLKFISSRHRVISSMSLHVKTLPLLRLHNKSRLLRQKLKGLVFVGVYIINRILHGAWRYEISLLVFKQCFTLSSRSLVEYCSTFEEKLRISAWPCNILYSLFHVKVGKNK